MLLVFPLLDNPWHCVVIVWILFFDSMRNTVQYSPTSALIIT